MTTLTQSQDLCVCWHCLAHTVRKVKVTTHTHTPSRLAQSRKREREKKWVGRSKRGCARRSTERERERDDVKLLFNPKSNWEMEKRTKKFYFWTCVCACVCCGREGKSFENRIREKVHKWIVNQTQSDQFSNSTQNLKFITIEKRFIEIASQRK